MGDGREGLIAAIQEECAVQHIMVPSALAASTGVAQVEDGLEAPAFSNPPPPPHSPRRGPAFSNGSIGIFRRQEWPCCNDCRDCG
jgi:hypothetical protein